MRVLFLTHRLPYAPNRGDRIRSLHMLQFLARQHVDVDLVSLAHDADEAAHATDLRDLVASVTVVRTRRWFGYGRALAALPTGGALTHALLNAPGLPGRIRALVARQRPDVVLSYCSGMTPLALAPPVASIPLVLDMVDVDSEKWKALAATSRVPARWVYAMEARRMAAFERIAARRARSVLVVNERERAAVLALEPGAEVRVVPNGVALDAFRSPHGPSDEPRVVFCGVMNYSPNEEGAAWLAKDVWPIVRRHQPAARLSLVGSDPTAAVRQLAASDATIEVTGAVPDVRPYLWRSAVATAPLQVSRGVQNKVLEAVAAGLPCIVTPVVGAGLPADVLPACQIVGEAEAFAMSILGLLSRTPAERRAIAERASLDRLGWSECLAPLMPILNAAAGSTSI